MITVSCVVRAVSGAATAAAGSAGTSVDATTGFSCTLAITGAVNILVFAARMAAFSMDPDLGNHQERERDPAKSDNRHRGNVLLPGDTGDRTRMPFALQNVLVSDQEESKARRAYSNDGNACKREDVEDEDTARLAMLGIQRAACAIRTGLREMEDVCHWHRWKRKYGCDKKLSDNWIVDAVEGACVVHAEAREREPDDGDDPEQAVKNLAVRDV